MFFWNLPGLLKFRLKITWPTLFEGIILSSANCDRSYMSHDWSYMRAIWCHIRAFVVKPKPPSGLKKKRTNPEQNASSTFGRHLNHQSGACPRPPPPSWNRDGIAPSARLIFRQTRPNYLIKMDAWHFKKSRYGTGGMAFGKFLSSHLEKARRGLWKVSVKWRKSAAWPLKSFRQVT